MSLGLSLGGSRASFGGRFLGYKSLIVRGVLLRLARLCAAGKQGSDFLVIYVPSSFAPVRVVLSVGSASPFGQNGAGAQEVYTFLKRLFFIVLGSVCEMSSPTKRYAYFWSMGLSPGDSFCQKVAKSQK